MLFYSYKIRATRPTDAYGAVSVPQAGLRGAHAAPREVTPHPRSDPAPPPNHERFLFTVLTSSNPQNRDYNTYSAVIWGNKIHYQ